MPEMSSLHCGRGWESFPTWRTSRRSRCASDEKSAAERLKAAPKLLWKYHAEETDPFNAVLRFSRIPERVESQYDSSRLHHQHRCRSTLTPGLDSTPVADQPRRAIVRGVDSRG